MSRVVVRKDGKVAFDKPLVDGQVYHVGRDTGNDFVLLSSRVSRRHARIEVIGGRCRIVDLESSNGLVHDGQRVTELMVPPGAEIEVGDFSLRFELDDASTPAAEDEEDAAKLVLIGGREQEVHPLSSSGTTLGRSEGSDIVLPTPLASGSHCRVVRRGGAYALNDLGSENGTYVDGVRVKDSPLRQGSQIRIAELTFYLAVDGVVPEPGTIELIQPVQTAQPRSAGAPAAASAPVAPRPAPSRPRVPQRGPQARQPRAGTAPAKRSPIRIIVASGAALSLLIVLAALLLTGSPDDRTEQEFQEVFQASLSAEEQERIGEYLAEADRLRESGNIQLALEQYRKVLAIDGSHQRSLAEAASIEEELGRRDAEREATEQEERARRTRVAELVERSDSAVAAGELAEARTLLEQAAELTPDSALVRSKRAAIYAAEGDALRRRGSGGARTAYRRALELDPQNPQARQGLARIDAGRREAQRRQQSIEELNERGLAELKREEYLKASRSFAELLELDPGNERAGEFRDQALQQLARQVQPIYEEGVRLYEAGEIAAAMQRFQSALELDPNHSDTKAFHARVLESVRSEAVDRYKRAYIFEGLGRYPEALALYRETLELLPDPAEEYHQKASERVADLSQRVP